MSCLFLSESESSGFCGYHFGTGSGISGILESDRTANGISEDQKSVAAVSVPSTDRYLPDRKGICGICSGSDPGSDRFSGRAGLSGTRDHIHGNQGIERQKREDLSMKKIKLIKILAGFLP